MYRAQLFWKVARVHITYLAELAYFAFTLTPSSAAAERVFSILKSVMTTQQMKLALTDYTQGSVMLAYNPLP